MVRVERGYFRSIKSSMVGLRTGSRDKSSDEDDRLPERELFGLGLGATTDGV